MRKTYAVLAVVLLIFLAGCVTVTVEFTVDGDGMVELDAEMEFDEMVVQFMEMELDEDEYDSVGEMMIADMQADLEDDTGDFDNIEYDYEELEDGGLLLLITSDPTDPATLDDISVTIDEDEATAEFISHDGIDDFEEDDGLNGADEDFQDMIDMRIIVHMPGEIQEHNGNLVDDTTVEWTSAEHGGTDELYALSEIDDDTAFAIPGFTAGITLLALGLLIAGSAYLHRRR